MVKLLNRLSQPITINLGNNVSKHVLAKETFDLKNKDLTCQEVKEKLDAEHIIILKITDK